MAKDFDSMEDSNRSANLSIHEVSDPARRVFLLGGIGALTGRTDGRARPPWRSARRTADPSGPESASAAAPRDLPMPELQG
ncbi:MAG TPA: hypothetical protein VK855_07680 [Thioalkalivibrio sp.]|nr:hypothetical protein [Thioalkalivibrio sp.]